MFIEILYTKGRKSLSDLNITGHTAKLGNEVLVARFSKEFIINNSVNKSLCVKMFIDENAILAFKFNEKEGHCFLKQTGNCISLTKKFSNFKGNYSLVNVYDENIGNIFLSEKKENER